MKFNVGALMLTTIFSSRVTAINVCLMVYQLADNDLEYSLREDNFELSISPAISDPSLTTWIYFDGRNFDDLQLEQGYYEDGTEVINEPLRNVFHADGTPVADKEMGSKYMTYDHAQQKLIVERTLEGEVDGDDPQVLYDFLTVALADCVENQAEEYMLILSSHGGGYAGFGGDENFRRRHRQLGRSRRLVQPNYYVAAAIQEALDDTMGAPSILDVLGFDACLMSAVGALDDYHRITKYYLASEATEPAHGWAYDFLDTTESAKDMALNLLTNFLVQPQGERHQSPKTLALIESQAFDVFLTAWDSFAEEMNQLITTDSVFTTLLGRARVSSLAFVGVADSEDTRTPSALDVGDFLRSLHSLCNPNPSSNLYTALQQANTTYNAMFVTRGVGPGTPSASTGVHIMWPTRRSYFERLDADPMFVHELFNTSLAFATADAPNYLEFLQNFYYQSLPNDSGNPSVCMVDSPDDSNDATDKLILDVDLSRTDTDVTINALLSRNTYDVEIRYGVPLNVDQGRRLLEFSKSIEATLPVSHQDHFFHSRSLRKDPSRQMQEPSLLYYIIFGGELSGQFFGSRYAAAWSRQFYVLTNGDFLSLAFAFEYAEAGFRSIPVIYFPETNPVTGDDIPFGTSTQDALSLGGVTGVLIFSIDDSEDSEVVWTLGLYTFNSFGVLSELPKRTGGFVTPVLYTDIAVDLGDGDIFSLTELVGGLDSTVFPWNEENDLAVVVFSDLEWLDVLKVDTVIVDITAYEEERIDFESIDVSRAFLSGEEVEGGGNPSVDATTLPPSSGEVQTPTALPQPSTPESTPTPPPSGEVQVPTSLPAPTSQALLYNSQHWFSLLFMLV